MYAAAGGASLASRQARARQRETKKKQQQSTQKPKDPFGKHNPQAKQFHNYTDDANPAMRLSRVERGALGATALKPPESHHERRHSHSTSNFHLKEAGKSRIRESPSICIPVRNEAAAAAATSHHFGNAYAHAQEMKCALQVEDELPKIFWKDEDGGGGGMNEEGGQESQKLDGGGRGTERRRCSFVRQVEGGGMDVGGAAGGGGGVLDRCNHLCNFEVKDCSKVWEDEWAGGRGGGFFGDDDCFGSLDYPFSECSQGRAAWQERERISGGGRRCSNSDEARHQHRIKQTEAHHRWMKRNRIHDSTYGTNSDEDDFFSVYHQSAAANALLYVGLGTTAIGSVIFFVGTGEKGFKTLELRLIGPTLVACGLLCCLIRVLLCACPSTCLRKRTNGKKRRLNDVCPHTARYPPVKQVNNKMAEGNKEKSDFLLNKDEFRKKVSIVHAIPSTSNVPAVAVAPSSVNFVNETTRMVPNVPEINLEPESELEMEHFELEYDVQSVSSAESEADEVEEGEKLTKLTKKREPANVKVADDDAETSLSVTIERNESKHSGIVLSPLELEQ